MSASSSEARRTTARCSLPIAVRGVLDSCYVVRCARGYALRRVSRLGDTPRGLGWFSLDSGMVWYAAYHRTVENGGRCRHIVVSEMPSCSSRFHIHRHSVTT